MLSKAAGATFCSIEGNAVTIADPISGRKIQTFASALRSVADVKRTLRRARELRRE